MKLTIFTPTYNRLSELSELHESIIESMKKIENGHSIEWMIIDDGSTIDISKVVNKFQIIENLSIVLIIKPNGGKHTAFNIAIDKANSDLFVCIDDDDRLTPNALGDILKLGIDFLSKGYGGFVGRVVNGNGKMLGATVFNGFLVSNTIEIRDKYRFWGEPEIFYTDILKKYRFEIFPGEKFLTEAYVFDKMSLSSPFVYTNIPLMVKNYLKGGLTSNQLKIRIENPQGAEAYYYQRKQLSRGIIYKLKATINERRFARYSTNIPKRKLDIYMLIAMPIAWIFSIKDQVLYKKQMR